jgi:putative tricarboxylic transport membrane protein
MLIFGVVGYLMKKFDYEPAPLVLCFVLGRMAEESIRQSLVLSRGSLMIFLTQPLVRTFLALAVIVALLPFVAPAISSLWHKLVAPR